MGPVLILHTDQYCHRVSDTRPPPPPHDGFVKSPQVRRRRSSGLVYMISLTGSALFIIHYRGDSDHPPLEAHSSTISS
jgi:hypothetical protein